MCARSCGARTPGRYGPSPSGCLRPPTEGSGRRRPMIRCSSCATPISRSRASSRRPVRDAVSVQCDRRPGRPARGTLGERGRSGDRRRARARRARGGEEDPGARGTAKTTRGRGLAPLVGRLVELPIGATADRVLGTLDLDRALAEGASAFKPGLLAAADGGLLYVDEVNLLPDHLVDVLLDAAALGRVHVERDGLSAAYDARFLLVGTMNPEEGDLRPQLLDRFGLSVDVTGSLDPTVRVEIVRRRLAFDRDPEGFAARFADEERALAARVAAARERDVRLPDRMLLLIAGTC